MPISIRSKAVVSDSAQNKTYCVKQYTLTIIFHNIIEELNRNIRFLFLSQYLCCQLDIEFSLIC